VRGACPSTPPSSQRPRWRSRAFIEKWQRQRHQVDYQIDGIVIKVDRYDQRADLGATSRAPRWAVAYKFPPEEKTALVKRIAVNTGRTGRVTPYVELEPVVVGGVTVSSATLHNESEVRRKDVREGDTVHRSPRRRRDSRGRGLGARQASARKPALAVPQRLPGLPRATLVRKETKPIGVVRTRKPVQRKAHAGSSILARRMPWISSTSDTKPSRRSWNAAG
jgi:hypothetical protein